MIELKILWYKQHANRSSNEKVMNGLFAQNCFFFYANYESDSEYTLCWHRNWLVLNFFYLKPTRISRESTKNLSNWMVPTCSKSTRYPCAILRKRYIRVKIYNLKSIKWRERYELIKNLDAATYQFKFLGGNGFDPLWIHDEFNGVKENYNRRA